MTDKNLGEPITYAAAGVDVQAGDDAVELMKSAVTATHSNRVLGGFGGFAGMWDATPLTSYRRPVLTTSTDGVGTKVAIAQAMDIHDTIGQDLVGMVVDDIVVVGAKPLFMTDYIATGKVVAQRVADIVRGIATGCQLADTALLGGETAEHPGLLAENEYDVAGAVTGVVEADNILGPERVRASDVVIAMESSGAHSNGFSLLRSIVAAKGWSWDQHIDEFGRSLGEELLEPTRIYAKTCLGLIDELNADGKFALRGFSHVTGGGLAANLARVLPQGTMATIDRSTWKLPAVFSVMSEAGQVPRADLERTLNLGVGMVAVVSADAAEKALTWLNAHGVKSWQIGEVGALDNDAATAGDDFVQGAKGVDGGGVLMHGAYAQ
ncbi:MAG: phosphoribosylformylglycinamidine cyclo-ligase [Yaniella sp.]|uniref:phosphoribosylformylglycinamidine cyclo-ligase n=1 Tax=Yaniella sp. TaxID=2773929 RepID=UPI00264A3815|nr:phosphoribosylformylglycinamidine cyclo-ligase [Yaniella sp.]MDN5730940.1 phosphoribosylformylglycinamidine cyclo-ligase [Yaniella sp.]MDN5817797.1 phosphoribosylformylglycinamidine cyclo-ligase [Yaniella sp.]MDN5839051.1 phosphoribosylformylglycinamidine cyclo-ligase [Yaniella sp.]MDN5912293.1 phosphoribosylformylglycinamidine cyclo-ligase [Yaniella sp.]MDN6149369.1 phosphoribosylformylglycinamidine cyclo-ligase [Yaniella sp.]